MYVFSTIITTATYLS